MSCVYPKSIFTSKFVFVLVFQFSYFLKDEREWVCVILNLLLTLVNFIILVKERPYYDKFVQKVTFVLLVSDSDDLPDCRVLHFSGPSAQHCNYLHIYCQLLTGNNYTGDTYVYILAIVAAVLLNLVISSERHTVIILKTSTIKDEYIMQKKIFCLLDLTDHQGKLKNEVFLKGYVLIQDPDDYQLKDKLMFVQETIEAPKQNNKAAQSNSTTC